jgi:hypothetical protein
MTGSTGGHRRDNNSGSRGPERKKRRQVRVVQENDEIGRLSADFARHGINDDERSTSAHFDDPVRDDPDAAPSGPLDRLHNTYGLPRDWASATFGTTHGVDEQHPDGVGTPGMTLMSGAISPPYSPRPATEEEAFPDLEHPRPRRFPPGLLTSEIYGGVNTTPVFDSSNISDWRAGGRPMPWLDPPVRFVPPSDYLAGDPGTPDPSVVFISRSDAPPRHGEPPVAPPRLDVPASHSDDPQGRYSDYESLGIPPDYPPGMDWPPPRGAFYPSLVPASGASSSQATRDTRRDERLGPPSDPRRRDRRPWHGGVGRRGSGAGQQHSDTTARARNLADEERVRVRQQQEAGRQRDRGGRAGY